MRERLQKILSSRGIASRRQAEKIIEAGRISCNGRICALGDSADPDEDQILLDGKPLSNEEKKIYIVLNKPRGYVTTLSDERGRKDVSMLVKDCGCRVYPVGRLDMDSEGLLLLTNDGDFANTMMHPRHEVNKLYATWVKNYSPNKAERLKTPVVLDGYQIHPPKVEVHSAEGERALLMITIHEGRNRQVRRMCAAADMQVVRLKRIAEGSLSLGTLPVGKWRYLTESEVSELMK